jgi:hypothetical protein
MRGDWKCVALAAAVLAASGGSSRADMSPVAEATEVMMESQGQQAILVGLLLGPAPSPLEFTSSVASDGGSFQYGLVSGSTYLGQAASWTTSGTLDVSTGLWTWQTTSSIGSSVLDSSGKGGPFTGVDPPYDTMIFQIHFTRTVISDVTYSQTATRTVSMGTITVTDELGTVVSTGMHTDNLVLQGPNAGQWEWDTGAITGALGKGDFHVVAAGLSPLPDGGNGTFAIRVVPEPSSALLAATGFLAVAAWRKGRNRS